MSLGDEGTDCASAFVVLLDREMGDDDELLRFRTGESKAMTEGACTAALLGTVIAISGDCGVGALLSKEPEATFTKEGSSDSAVGSTSHGMLTGAVASPLLTGIDDADADTAAADDDAVADDDAGDGGDAQTTSAFSAAAAAATEGDNAVDTASKVNTVTAGAVDKSADDGDDADTTAVDSTDGDDDEEHDDDDKHDGDERDRDTMINMIIMFTDNDEQKLMMRLTMSVIMMSKLHDDAVMWCTGTNG